MRRNLILSVLGTVFAFSLFACVRGGDEKMMQFECEKQNSGEACNKLGLKRKGEEALRYFRLGCEKQSTVACLSLAERTENKEEALKVLRQACEWKNSTACIKANKMAAPVTPPVGTDTGGGAGQPVEGTATGSGSGTGGSSSSNSSGGSGSEDSSRMGSSQQKKYEPVAGSENDSWSKRSGMNPDEVNPVTGRKKKKGYYRKRAK